MNSVILVGKVLDDFIITKRGDYEVANTRIQVLTGYKNYDGQMPEENIPVTLWEPLQRHPVDVIKAGDYVVIRGHIHSFEFSQDDGTRKHILDICVDKMTMVPKC